MEKSDAYCFHSLTGNKVWFSIFFPWRQNLIQGTELAKRDTAQEGKISPPNVKD